MPGTDRTRRILEVAANVGTIASSIAIVFVAVLLARTLLSKGSSLSPQAASNTAVAAPPVATKVDALETTANLTTQHHDGAKIVIVEFSDFQCPFCGRYARDTFEKIQREFVDRGVADYVFRDFPLESIHPLAFKAAEAAECAGEQGKYWEMHKLIFARQDHLDDPALLARAKDLKLDEAAFRTCLSGKTVSKIKGDQSEGTRLGIRSTPTFFVGVTLPNGRIKLMRRIDGAAPYESLKNAIDDVAVDAKGVS